MDKPEEILKQLNKQSASLQPNVVRLLEEIQDRFFTPEGDLKAELTGDQQDQVSQEELPSRDLASAKNSDDQTDGQEFWPAYDHSTPSPGNSPDSQSSKSAQKGRTENRAPTTTNTSPVKQPNFLGSGSGGQGQRRQAVAASISSQTAKANQELNDIFLPGGMYQQSFSAEPETSVTASSTEANQITSVPVGNETVIRDESQIPTAGHVESGGYSESATLPQDIGTELDGSHLKRSTSIPMAMPIETKIPTIEETPVRNPVAEPHFKSSTQPSKIDEETDSDTILFSDPKNLERPLAVYHSNWLRSITPDREIGIITSGILKKAPPEVSHTIQLVATEDSTAPTHEVATRIAWELSIRQDGPVLLVDADFETREISRQLDNVYLPGLAESLNQGLDWRSYVGSTGIEGLFWLPSGKSDITHRKATSARWSVLSQQLKKQFRYVCIYSGSSNNIVARTWSRYCDFTFLIANMQDELGEGTKQAVENLRKHDCRLAGLVTIK